MTEAVTQCPQLAHEPELQLAQAAELVVCFSTPDIPKVDGSFSTSADRQPGQVTEAAAENMSFSNRSPQSSHRNSNTGIATLHRDGRSHYSAAPSDPTDRINAG
jgi:hypothetical protein